MTNISNYTAADIDRCIELCEELMEELLARLNRNRKRLSALNIEKARRDLQAAVNADKEAE